MINIHLTTYQDKTTLNDETGSEEFGLKNSEEQRTYSEQRISNTIIEDKDPRTMRSYSVSKGNVFDYGLLPQFK